MGVYSKVKYVGKVFVKTPKKGTLIKKTLRVLKNKGVSGLKQAIKETGEKQELAIDLYQKQQSMEKKYKEYPESVLFVIWSWNEYVDIYDTYRTIVSQMKSQDHLVVVKSAGHADWENRIECEKMVCNKIDGCLGMIAAQYNQDYVYFIKGGNYLAPNMRNEFAQVMYGNHPDMIYSDESVFSHEKGDIVRHDLRANFSEYDFMQGNHDMQSVMFRRRLLENPLWNNVGTEYLEDILFQMVLEISSEKCCIEHIAQILLLKKDIIEKKDLPLRRSILEQKFRAQGILANVIIENSKLKVCPYKGRYKASIIIIGKENEKIRQCIEDLFFHTANVEYELIIVDTEDDFRDMPEKFLRYGMIKSVFCTENMTYTEKCNIATKEAEGDVLVFIQDDMRVQHVEWLSELMGVFAFPKVAAASPKIVREDNTIRYAGMIAGGFGFTPIPFNGEMNQCIENFNEPAFLNHQVSVLSASCLAVKKSVFEEVGGFLQEEFSDKFSNAQLSFEVARSGYACVYCADSVLVAKSEEWFDSWYDKEHPSAYLQLLKNYGEELSEDRYFTDSMKYQYLRGVPIDFKIYQKKKDLIKKEKSVLMISHDSLLGGATIAFQYAARALKKSGYHVVWMAGNEGAMMEELKRDGIGFMIDPSFRGSDKWLHYAKNFDLVICSTIVLCPQVEKLKNTGKKVIWWLHDAKDYYVEEVLTSFSYEHLNNLDVWCGGTYAEKVFKEHFSGIDTKVLLYGMPDYAKNKQIQETSVIDNPLNKMIFLSIGTFESRKGQDILVEAIERLDASIREECLFVFLGKPVQHKIYEKIEELHKKYPNSVLVMKPVDRDTLMKLYQQGDVVLCTSREDPMPVFMTECMMQSKIAICSENTGTAGVLTDGWDSFVYHGNSSNELAEKIIYVINHSGEMYQIKENARKTYEKYFSMEVFEKNLLMYVEKALEE